jgi:hypothetical protein
LRRKKSSVFFIATNRLRAFDSAIIRPGTLIGQTLSDCLGFLYFWSL